MFFGSHAKISIAKFLFVILTPLFFIVSIALTTPYTGGDQRFYRAFYEDLAGSALEDIALLQYINTGSAEPMYGILMWVGANAGIDKDIYIGLFNVLLCLFVLKFLLKNRASIPFSVLVFSNYYLFVLLTSAERLKFAYIFLMIAAASQAYFWPRVWVLIACFCHFQSFILMASRVAGYFSRVRIGLKVRLKIIALSIVCIPVGITLIIVFIRFFSDILLLKLSAYSDSGGVGAILNIAILALFSIFIFEKKYEVVISLLVCGMFALILGSERVNMIAVSIFLYFSCVYRRTSNLLVLLVLLYFSIKSIDYVMRIFLYGSGFHEGNLF